MIRPFLKVSDDLAGIERNFHRWIPGRIVDPNWRTGVMLIEAGNSQYYRRHDSETVKGFE